MSTISVRQISITDIPRLRRLCRVHVSLAFPDAMCHSQFDDVLAAVPLGRRYARVFVSGSEDAPCAMLEVRPEPEDFRWLVTGLATRCGDECESPNEAADHWSSLLSYAANVAGSAGAKRVHASAPLDGPASRALTRAGFTVYAHQTIMRAEGLRFSEERGETVHVRERDPSDAWSIHHLYHRTTPRPVQYAEALTSNHWDSHRALHLRTRGFVIDDRDGLSGYCQVATRGNQHALDLLMLPEKRHLLSAFLVDAVRMAKLGAGAPLWIAVPDYHREFLPMLESLGFGEVARQSLMVRYTMVPACEQPSRWSHAVSEVIERLPSRVPVISRCGRVDS